MAVIELETRICAPRELVFDMKRSVDVHLKSTLKTGERVVAGKQSGLLELGDVITWEARHLFVKQRLTVKIIEMDQPGRFVDEMQPGQGAFKRLRHEHYFEEVAEGTLMKDRFIFEAPLGILGRLAEVILLKRYLSHFLIQRNEILKQMAEEATKKNTAEAL